MTATVTVPTVHMNGTRGDELFGAYVGAMDLVRAALAGLPAPNARDYYYYVQGPDAFTRAATEHAARSEKLRAMLAELEAIAEGIVEQNDAREAARTAQRVSR